MNGTHIAILVALAYLWPKSKSAGCKCSVGTSSAAATIAAAEGGTDSEMTWWDKFHGKDVAIHNGNYFGVSPDPDSTGKVEIAASANINWRGDLG